MILFNSLPVVWWCGYLGAGVLDRFKLVFASVIFYGSIKLFYCLSLASILNKLVNSDHISLHRSTSRVHSIIFVHALSSIAGPARWNCGRGESRCGRSGRC